MVGPLPAKFGEESSRFRRLGGQLVGEAWVLAEFLGSDFLGIAVDHLFVKLFEGDVGETGLFEDLGSSAKTCRPVSGRSIVLGDGRKVFGFIVIDVKDKSS